MVQMSVVQGLQKTDPDFILCMYPINRKGDIDDLFRFCGDHTNGE